MNARLQAIREYMQADPDYGVYDGVLSRSELQLFFDEIARLTSERDAAISDMIPVCCVCKHFYKKAKGVYSCHKAGDMENVYSWDNDYSCPMWEWRGLCAENAPEGTCESKESR